MKHAQKLQIINARCEHGIFVGVRKRSNELAIAAEDGTHFVRSVKRIPFENKWGEDCVSWVKWTPWNRSKDAVDADGDIPEGITVDESAPRAGIPDMVVYLETKDKAPREFYTSHKDVEKHSFY